MAKKAKTKLSDSVSVNDLHWHRLYVNRKMSDVCFRFKRKDTLNISGDWLTRGSLGFLSSDLISLSKWKPGDWRLADEWGYEPHDPHHPKLAVTNEELRDRLAKRHQALKDPPQG